jgi:hypothetical protein
MGRKDRIENMHNIIQGATCRLKLGIILFRQLEQSAWGMGYLQKQKPNRYIPARPHFLLYENLDFRFLNERLF